MATDEISEKRDDARPVYRSTSWVDKFEQLEKHVQQVNEEILSTRKCIDFIMKEIEVANTFICNYFTANQRRLILLRELNEKMGNLVDSRDTDCKDMIDLLPRDIFFKSCDNYNK